MHKYFSNNGKINSIKIIIEKDKISIGLKYFIET
jgi:hypothetical protein